MTMSFRTQCQLGLENTPAYAIFSKLDPFRDYHLFRLMQSYLTDQSASRQLMMFGNDSMTILSLPTNNMAKASINYPINGKIVIVNILTKITMFPLYTYISLSIYTYLFKKIQIKKFSYSLLINFQVDITKIFGGQEMFYLSIFLEYFLLFFF